MKPLIGIPLCLDDANRWVPGREYEYIDSAYAAAIAEAGGAPVYLPVHAEVADLIVRLDGVCIPGGDDFLPPVEYGSDVRFAPTPRARVDFDRLLLAFAWERAIPILAICYGMQLLALHHGGALHYHIPMDCPAAGPHDAADGQALTHVIDVEAVSHLAGILGPGSVPVNSRHHQAVASPGRGLRVCAQASDGLIEAIERETDGFCVGVQWHPERMDAAHRARLFGAFVQACATRANA